MMLKMPYFRQRASYTCGLACVRMLLAFHGIKASDQQLMQKLTPRPETGTARRKMVLALRGYGLHCKGNAGDWSDVRACLDRGLPVIVNYLHEDDEGHYAVIIGKKPRTVVLHDPWGKPSAHMSVRSFTRAWYGHRTQDASRGWMLVAWK